ncbi:SWIM zinc finger family protein [Corynebacterium sp. AOP40-9SA-29]|uniref:SWIM zinc finger family protein n=1 Tax=Corynebacterium sp. AOP40-9SA-29 TaxID=3457677 RepID=UPI0040347D55
MAEAEFGATLWGRAWLRTVERTDGTPRAQLPKARSLARNHKVELVLPGAAGVAAVTATVADGSSTHTVTLAPCGWSAAEQDAAGSVLAALRPDASGDLPDDLIGRFSDAGVSVVPATPDETASCTCRARSKPCAHILATLYTVVSTIDERPLTALELRCPDGIGSGGGNGGGADADADADWIALEDIDPATFFDPPVR